MTDLEITRLCAEAMGPESESGIRLDGLAGEGEPYSIRGRRPYDPLHDDAQAMALVKKMQLDIRRCHESGHDSPLHWRVYEEYSNDGLKCAGKNTDLNRAICECVAKMQKAKVAA